MALQISTAIFKAAFATEAIFKLQVVMRTLLIPLIPFINGINELTFFYL